MRVCLLTCCLAILVSPAFSLTWEIEIVDNGKVFSSMTNRSLRLDVEGRPHVAYGEDNLYHAFFDGTAWQYEVVDWSQGVGRHASLALDGSGYPHISYHDDTSDDLKYAYRDDSGWHTEIVDVQGNMGKYTSLALDVFRCPHIGYYDETNENLNNAYRDGAGWCIETVDETGSVGQYTSLALDGSGYIHISYDDATNGDLKYARASGQTVIELTASLNEGQLVLSWTPVVGAAAYWAYGTSNEPWFAPDTTPPIYVNRVAVVPTGTTTWSSPNGVVIQTPTGSISSWPLPSQTKS